MSRVIVNDHPYTDDEIDYLRARGLESSIKRNKLDFPPDREPAPIVEEDAPLELSPDVFNYVKNLSLDELKSDLSKSQLSLTGEEKDLRVTLAKHLQAQADSK